MIKLKKLLLQSVNAEQKIQKYLILNNKLQIKIKQLLNFIDQNKQNYYVDYKSKETNKLFNKYQKIFIVGKQRLKQGKVWVEHLSTINNHNYISLNQLQRVNALIKSLNDLTNIINIFTIQIKKYKLK